MMRNIRFLIIALILMVIVVGAVFAVSYTLEMGYYNCPDNITVPKLMIGNRINDTCNIVAYDSNGKEKYTSKGIYNDSRKEITWSGHTFKIINETCFSWQGKIYTLDHAFW